MKAINPSSAADQLGTPDHVWPALYVAAIYGAEGQIGAFLPINADDVQGGLLNPALINNLNSATEVDSGPTTLAAIIANAALGAQDPVARINAGAGGLNGSKIATDSLDPNAINANAFIGRLVVGQSGMILGAINSSDYAVGVSGWAYTVPGWEVNLATAIFRGVLRGSISINGRFNVNNNGQFQIGDPAQPQSQHGILNDGTEWWGADTYANAQMQADHTGNFFLSDSLASLSNIDPGAINIHIAGIMPSQAGGVYATPITLTPQTRGSLIFYTLDGSDPTSSGTRLAYSAPIHLSPPVTLKAIAYKLGHYSAAVQSWAFVLNAGAQTQVDDPVFTPPAGFYNTSDGILHGVVLNSPGTVGETIRYTLDGTDPTSGIIYSGPIDLTVTPPATSITLRARSSKAGLTSSNIVTGVYSITRGGVQGGGGGGGHDYQR